MKYIFKVIKTVIYKTYVRGDQVDKLWQAHFRKQLRREPSITHWLLISVCSTETR